MFGWGVDGGSAGGAAGPVVLGGGGPDGTSTGGGGTSTGGGGGTSRSMVWQPSSVIGGFGGGRVGRSAAGLAATWSGSESCSSGRGLGDRLAYLHGSAPRLNRGRFRRLPLTGPSSSKRSASGSKSEPYESLARLRKAGEENSSRSPWSRRRAERAGRAGRRRLQRLRAKGVGREGEGPRRRGWKRERGAGAGAGKTGWSRLTILLGASAGLPLPV